LNFKNAVEEKVNNSVILGSKIISCLVTCGADAVVPLGNLPSNATVALPQIIKQEYT